MTAHLNPSILTVLVSGNEGMMKRTACILLCTLLYLPAFTVMVSVQATRINHISLKLTETMVNLETTIDGESRASGLVSTPLVTILVVPISPPVRIPPSGSSFDYSISVANNEIVPLTFHVWTVATLPNGKPYGPVIGVQVSLPGGWSGSSDLALNVPDFAPQGNYTYHGYVGIYPDNIWDSDHFTFEKLSSGGWFAQNSETSAVLTDVYFTDAENGWAVGSVRTILHTKNGGNNWYPQTSEKFSTFYGVYFTDVNTGWTVGSLGVIIHTEDGGSSWITQNSGSSHTLQDVHFIDDNTGWAVGGREPSFQPPRRVILHTTDGGINWNTQLSESNFLPLYSVCFIDANRGWAVGGMGAILHTSDGGAHWYPQASGTSTQLESVHFADDNVGWVVGRDGTILHTIDGGSFWSPQVSGTSVWLKSVCFVDDHTGWTVGGDGVVLHTTNAGDTWIAQTSSTTNALFSVHFIDDKTGWAVGIDSEIIHTTTGGIT